MIQNEKVREALIDVYNRCFDTTDDVDVLAEYISELEARIPQWISVKDRLPEDDEMKLITLWDCNSMRMAYYYEQELWICNGVDVTGFVTHWMPLPEPPEENE